MKKRTPTSASAETIDRLVKERDKVHLKRQRVYEQEWTRLAKCTAWYREVGERYVFLQSYETLVAVFDREDMTLYVFGRYSSTTYQHVRKFRNNVVFGNYASARDYSPWTIPEVNLELTDWFAD